MPAGDQHGETFYSTRYYREKYANERTRLADYFPSERRFLERIVQPGMRVLDIGCACGGLIGALAEIADDVSYIGVDVTPELLEIGQERYPEATFILADATGGVPVEQGSVDLVTAFGVAVHEPRYRDVLSHAYDVTRRYLLYDVRIHGGAVETVDMDTAYVVNASGLRNHYVVTPYADVEAFAVGLEPPPQSVEIYGYYSPVGTSKSVILPSSIEQVCTAGVLVTRSGPHEETRLHVELPDDVRGDQPAV